ncbi:MAG: hypothetical protein ABIN89_08655 [Chitinophagaceae bacterium]
MLSGDFFTISSVEAEGNSAKAVLELKQDHDIFKGHFPGMPVVPGVCMMQMVHEMMEQITDTSLLLLKADLMKFLVVINPLVNKIVDVDLSYKAMDDQSFTVNANLSANGVICFKFKGVFASG